MSSESYIKQIQLRWADIDVNRHVLHSRYYEWGATVRMEFLVKHGITVEWLEANNIGPILFREECQFRKEVRFADEIIMDVVLTKAKKDYSRWSLRHHITKADNTLAAIINIDGAWLDLTKRKLATPNETIVKAFELFPKSKDFEWL
ncbi:MAG: acyl-CoA thioesterase [Bacteroidota bacterium]